jgi:hypothetical protein
MARFAFPITVLVLTLTYLLWQFWPTKQDSGHSALSTPVEARDTLSNSHSGTSSSESAPTSVYAHNLKLRKGANFRVYVRWLRGQMVRTRHNINPSFDDPESFVLDVKTGVIRANIGDISIFLNTIGGMTSRLKNITLSGDGDQIKLQGILHKIIRLPIELTGKIAAVPDNRIQVHVTKLSVLKIPMKGLFGAIHIGISTFFPMTSPAFKSPTMIFCSIRKSFYPHLISAAS